MIVMKSRMLVVTFRAIGVIDAMDMKCPDDGGRQFRSS